jgi:hypothetical protein
MSKKKREPLDEELPELAMPDLTPEQALAGFMAVDPERMRESEEARAADDEPETED